MRAITLFAAAFVAYGLDADTTFLVKSKVMPSALRGFAVVMMKWGILFSPVWFVLLMYVLYDKKSPIASTLFD